MNNILILVTHYGYFMRSLINPNDTGGIQVGALENYLKEAGFTVKTLKFEDIETTIEYKDWYVLYASSEDWGLFYKSYIEDILLRLQLSGAILIPGFEYFRAHHNKSFMEGYRNDIADARLKTIHSIIYGGFLSYKDSNRRPQKFPVVVKPSEGAGASGVTLVQNQKELDKVAKRTAGKSLKNKHDYNILKLTHRFLGKLIRSMLHIKTKRDVGYYRMTSTNKFIVQNFIPNLSGDYKVLVFYDKYYCLKRENRRGDFRASGSGNFSFPENMEDIKMILDFAYISHAAFNSPVSSLDIGFDGGTCHLIEFQFVEFGPYTLQHSKFYWSRHNDIWQRIEETPNLEREYSRAIIKFITPTP